MNYFSLERRVPEVSAVEPRSLARLYAALTRVPLVRSTHRRFVNSVVALGVIGGYGLDLGTGPGNVAVELACRQPDLRIVGLDLAAHMVDLARKRASQAGLSERGHWPLADAHALPFADASFNLVVSSFALHHWNNPLQVMNEIARVLVPGGQYLITDVCRDVNGFQRLFAYASIPVVSMPFGSYRGYGGYYESVRAGYTLAEARGLLHNSSLPPGTVTQDSTWFVPVVTIRSKRRA